MTWFDICDLAECSPDFDVVYRMNRFDAVNWLRARLIARNNEDEISLKEIERAYDERHDA